MVYTFNEYNHFEQLPLMQKKIVDSLIQNPDANPLFNLLYYNDNNALDNTYLTTQQKGKLIYDGSPISTPFRIFFNPFLDDAFTEECSLLRIFPELIIPNDRIRASITFRIECFTHVKVSTLSNYQTREVTMLQLLLQCLNGVDIGGVGFLSFDRMGNPADKAYLNISNSRNYSGYSLYLSTRTASS